MRAAVVDNRLEAMAGSPLASYTASGTFTPSPLPVPSAGYSLYGVIDVNDASGFWWTWLTAGTDAAGQVRIAQSGGNLIARWRRSGDGADIGGGVVGPATTGRHVFHQVTLPGETAGIAGIDGAESQFTLTGTGSGFANLFFASASANQVGVRALVYNRAHNRFERARVLGWLARRYGTPLTA